MNEDKPFRLETIAVHAGQAIDPATGAVTLPIHLSTTFEREADGSYPRGYIYIRNANPTRAALEECLRALEGGAAAAAFASGSAAMWAIFQALSPGDHVLIPDDVYAGTRRQLQELLAPWGLEMTGVDMTDPAQVERALRPRTRLLWVETPSNPLLKISDIARLAELAHRHGAWCVCDNTWATPLGQRPLELGADLVVHSTTKYLGGHSDTLGGAVIAKETGALWERIKSIQVLGGAVLAPFDCWLTLRGIRTLPYRLRAHAANAQRVAEFLQRHPKVERVHYPGLEEHPGHAIAKRQMLSYGGMLSCQVRGGREEALAVAAKVRLFTRATSLGGPESLIEHRASIEGPSSPTPQNLLRLSIGLENAEDLIADLAQALA